MPSTQFLRDSKLYAVFHKSHKKEADGQHTLSEQPRRLSGRAHPANPNPTQATDYVPPRERRSTSVAPL